MFWLTAFIFLIAHSGFSQLPGFEKIRITVPGEEPVFKKAVMDADGYIWLGSGQGLFRFDGIQFKSFTPLPDTADFHVTALHLDQDHDLWIGCRDGKIYRLDQGRINLFNPEEGTSGVAITDILVAKDHSIWWSTAGEGIYFYSGTRVFNINRDDGLPDDYVHDLESVSDGYVVAGTDGGLVACIYRNGEKIVNPLAPTDELPDIMVTVVKEDSEGNLWLGFQDGGIGFLTNYRRQFVQPSADHAWDEGPVSAITVSGASVWAGTSSGKLLEISLNENRQGVINLLPADLQTGKIYDLLEDREGNIWILSAEGLFRSTGNRIRYLDAVGGIPLENIHAIHADEFRPGLLWFSDDRGLFSLAVKSGDVKSYPGPFKGPGLKITCLNQDRFGYIWAGTFNYGAIRLNPADGSFDRITERDNLVNNNVLSISRHHDTLWMATLGGASEIILDPNTSGRSYQARSYNYENGLVNNFIYYVYEDDKNRVWLATDG
ncbi:MAG: two-component regulator propeller domain-containing protein, partial [Bacteroidales bacterium]|nr:two-component regulator propeller domain-containing protein [Bacteroidales bacterium]